jgi:hypothetical protein
MHDALWFNKACSPSLFPSGGHGYRDGRRVSRVNPLCVPMKADILGGKQVANGGKVV